MEIAKSLFSLERSEGGNYALSKMDEKKIYLSLHKLNYQLSEAKLE